MKRLPKTWKLTIVIVKYYQLLSLFIYFHYQYNCKSDFRQSLGILTKLQEAHTVPQAKNLAHRKTPSHPTYPASSLFQDNTLEHILWGNQDIPLGALRTVHFLVFDIYIEPIQPVYMFLHLSQTSAETWAELGKTKRDHFGDFLEYFLKLCRKDNSHRCDSQNTYFCFFGYYCLHKLFLIFVNNWSAHGAVATIVLSNSHSCQKWGIEIIFPRKQEQQEEE